MIPFRLGIIGAGLIAREAHLPAALSSSLIEVTAIVDPMPGRAGALIDDFGIRARAATSVNEVTAQMDGAVVATPNDTHFSVASELIRAGIPVLVEKPLCTTVADAEALAEMAASAHVALATGYATRFRDNVVFLKELLDTAEFGAVQRFIHQFGSAGGWAPLSGYTLSRSAAGGGVLVVSATHFLDRMIYFWGEPESCALEDDGVGGPECDAVATFQFNHQKVQFEGIARYSKAAALAPGLVIQTDLGILRLLDTDTGDVEFQPRANPSVTHIVRRRGQPRFDGRTSTFQHQLEDFVNAVRDGRQPFVDGMQGLASLRLIARLYGNRLVTARHWYAEATPP